MQSQLVYNVWNSFRFLWTLSLLPKSVDTFLQVLRPRTEKVSKLLSWSKKGLRSLRGSTMVELLNSSFLLTNNKYKTDEHTRQLYWNKDHKVLEWKLIVLTWNVLDQSIRSLMVCISLISMKSWRPSSSRAKMSCLNSGMFSWMPTEDPTPEIG